MFDTCLSFLDPLPRREAGWVRELPGQVCAAPPRWAPARGHLLLAADGRDLRLLHGERAWLASPRGPRLAPRAPAAGFAGPCLSPRRPDGPLLRLLCRAWATPLSGRGGHYRENNRLKPRATLSSLKAMKALTLSIVFIVILRRLSSKTDLFWITRTNHNKNPKKMFKCSLFSPCDIFK